MTLLTLDDVPVAMDSTARIDWKPFTAHSNVATKAVSSRLRDVVKDIHRETVFGIWAYVWFLRFMRTAFSSFQTSPRHPPGETV